tara:strand:+ start:1713 stop:1880 length:168 start_codon:yes stop_codon:yes gene_type:complete
MTAEVVNFYKHWKKKQEKLRITLGFPDDIWYTMLDNGYEPSNPDSVAKFLEDLDE